MQLSDATLVIRPRTTWEAMDLGVLLGQRHRRLLMTSWAIITLPVFILLSAVLWESPSLALLIFWWLKPAFERLPLYILSKTLFGTTPSFKQALLEWPRLLRPQLLASLTWRRFSLSRSFAMPVVQLEGLHGLARQQRLQVLLQRDAGAAQWVTIIGVTLECALWIGMLVLFYLLLPQHVSIDWSWQTLITATQQDWLWLEHLSNAFYVLILVVWEPMYVACGFSLYLNRRTVLEAWDIELAFRRLRQRLSGNALVVLLAALVLMPATQTAWATQAQPSPNSPRLLDQPLTSQASRDSIKKILEQAPFKNTESVTRYRFGEAPHSTAEGGSTPEWLKALLDRLDGQRFGAVATLLEAILWGILIASTGWLIWRYRDVVHALVSHRPTSRSADRPSPQHAFGLDLRRDALPADIATHAEQLWQTQPREALALLYRALLSHLLNDFNLVLKPADTEVQVLQRIEQLQQPALLAFSKTLTGHWQTMAYGHRLPPELARQQLCDGWRALFGPGGSR